MTYDCNSRLNYGHIEDYLQLGGITSGVKVSTEVFAKVEAELNWQWNKEEEQLLVFRDPVFKFMNA